MKDFSKLEPIDYFRIPWRRRWYFLSAMVIVIAGSVGYAWHRPIYYRSEALILVESSTILDDTLGGNVSRDRMEERASAIRQLVESRTILQRIVEEFRLRSMDSSMLMEEALLSIRKNLAVSKLSGNTFTIAYDATEPQQAQAVTRRLAEILIQVNQSAQQNLAVGKDQFLEQELRQAEEGLTDLDEKIKQFKASHLGQLPEQAAANMNALSGLHAQLAAIENSIERARDQQKTLEFRLQEQKRLVTLARELAPKDQPAAAPVKRKEPASPLEVQLQTKRAQLADMIARYTDRHPDVLRLSQEIRELEQRAASAPEQEELTPLEPPASTPSARASTDFGRTELTTEAEIAQTKFELQTVSQTIERRDKERESVLKSINIYQDRLNMAPSLEQELLTLTREHETKRQQVENLQTRKFNAQMAANAVADKKFETYRILDDASLPEKPVPPTRLQIVLIGIAISFGAGLAAAYAREYFEPSLAHEEEAVAVLKIPVLVSVPEIPEK